MDKCEMFRIRRAEAREILDEAWSVGIPGSLRRFIEQRIAGYDQEIDRLVVAKRKASSAPSG